MMLSRFSPLLALLFLSQASFAAPRLIFPLTVSWEILRSGFISTVDVALEADYYGEEWTLSYQDDETILLRTPRGTAKGIALKATESDVPFDLIAIPEIEFARILGVQSDAANPAQSHMFVDFTGEAREEQYFSFQANPKYYLNVTFRMLPSR